MSSAPLLLELAVDVAPDKWIPMQTQELSIGRSHSCDLTLGGPKVSRKHARIVEKEGAFFLEDLGSAGGTWVRGGRLDSPYPVSDGLEFRVGDNMIRCRLRGEKPLEPASVPEEPAAEPEAPPEERAPQASEETQRILWLSVHPGRWQRAASEQVVIGRAPGVDLRIDSPVVSRRHALIRRKGSSLLLEDLGSTSGTRVGGELVRDTPVELGEDAALLVGDAPLLCSLRPEPLGPPEDAGQVPLLLDVGDLSSHRLEKIRSVIGPDEPAQILIPGSTPRMIELALREGSWVGLIWQGPERSGEGIVVSDGEEIELGRARLRLVLPRGCGTGSRGSSPH